MPDKTSHIANSIDINTNAMKGLLKKLIDQNVQLQQRNGNIIINTGDSASIKEEALALSTHKAEVLDFLKDKKIAGLSLTQENIWLACQPKDSAHYHHADFLQINGHFDQNAFLKALKYLSGRHESLRTGFSMLEGTLIQEVHPVANISFDIVNLMASAKPEQAQQLAAIKTVFYEDSFDLSLPSLIRAKVIKPKEDQFLVGICTHQLISDSLSLAILTRELHQSYLAYAKGEEPKLPALPFQYMDYVLWMKQEEAGKSEEMARTYWRELLDGTKSLELPSDVPSAEQSSGKLRSATLMVSDSIIQKLSQTKALSEMSLDACLVSAVYILLQKYSGQFNFCVGMNLSNRSDEGVRGMVGLLSDELAIRLKNTDHQQLSVQELVTVVHQQLSEGKTHAHEAMVAYQQYLEQYGQRVLQVMVNDTQRQPEYHRVLEQQGENVSSDLMQCDLVFSLFPTADNKDYTLSIDYADDLFQPETVAQMNGCLSRILNLMPDAVAESFTAIELLDKAEINRQLAWGNSEVKVGKDGLLHDFMTDWALKHPSKTAIAFRDEQLSYEELNKRSDALAIYLQGKGIGPNDLVGVCMKSTPQLMVSLYAVLKAGGAYVPIDPAYPAERIEFIVEDTKCKLLLTDDESSAMIPALSPGQEVLNVTNLDAELANQPGTLRRSTDQHQLAYVIYTSGSTGKPKGVKISHWNAMRMISPNFADLQPNDVVMHLSNFAFDGSMFDIFTTLCNGAQMAIFDKEQEFSVQRVINFINEYRVTISFFTTALLNAVIDQQPEALLPLRKILFGGEKASVKHINRAVALLGDDRLLHLYGPTETTVYATWYPVRKREYHHAIPIGKAFTDTQLYVLDTNRKLQPARLPGELYIGGRGVSSGYLNRDELTRERFVDNPFAPGTKMYRSGDLVRWNAEGELEFISRVDDQVKVRGYRIELGEIENVFQQLDTVDSVAVIVREVKGTNQLIGYYTGTETPSEVLKAQLAEKLPEFMVPVALGYLDEIPMTANGKVNKKLLATRQIQLADKKTLEASAEGTAAGLIKIWEELLDLKNIGAQDNFFELGGHSLLITDMLMQIEEQFGVSLSLKEVFKKPVVQHIADMIDGAEGSATVEARLAPVKGVDQYPLSFAQERLWFLHKMGLSHQYHIAALFKMTGDLDLEALTNTFKYLTQRHESFRTVFREAADQPYQHVLTEQVLDVTKDNISHLKGPDQQQLTDQVLADFMNRPFDLSNGPLLRILVLKVDQETTLMGVNMHHIISDGWSTSILIREFEAVYKSLQSGSDPSLSPLEIQYKDYAYWQQTQLAGDWYKSTLQHWKDHLEGYEDLAMPTDFQRPAKLSGAGNTVELTLNKSITERLPDFAKSQGMSNFAVLLTGVYGILHYYTRQESINIGIPMANRNQPQIGEIVGFFANTVVNRVLVDPASSFAELSRVVSDELIRSQEHQDVPFERIVEAVNPERDQSRTPLFQMLVNHLNFEEQEINIPGLQLEPLPSGYQQAKFDLDLAFVERKDGSLLLSLEYSADLYKEASMRQLLKQYENLLAQVLFSPDDQLSDVSLLSEQEEQRLIVEVNQTQTDYASTFCVHQLFAQQAKANPQQIALRHREASLTYEEVDQRSDQLAAVLVATGVSVGDFVGICMDRGTDFIYAVLAILKAGAAYVPMGIENPDERIQYMIEDSDIQVLLTDVDRRDRVNAMQFSGEVICFDEQLKNRLNEHSEPFVQSVVSSDDLIYVIYTSGSTGKPKGVMLTHKGLVNYLMDVKRGYRLDNLHSKLNHFAFFGNISFDATATTFLTPLISGGTCHVYDAGYSNQEVLKLILEHEEIDAIKLTPSHLQLILDSNIRPVAASKVLIVGGEALKTALVASILSSGMAVQVINEYGPTECSVAASIHLYDPTADYSSIVHIGQPLANMEAYVLDANGKPLPAGIPGELYLGGVGVAKGYYNREELTTERFIDNPFKAGEKIYKTGDLVRWTTAANLEFLGRIDEQVKLRGYRIEPGEIESVMMEHPAVDHAAVVVKKQEDNDLLVGFYAGGTSVDPDEFKRLLMRKLPEFMVPAVFEEIETIPLTPNGKVNKRLLAAKNVSIISTTEFVAPRNETEQKIAEIWQELLKVDQLGVYDKFFELGGHSLLASRVISRINQTFNTNLSVGAIFSADQVALLAAELEGSTLDGPTLGGSTLDGGTSAASGLKVMDRPAKIPLSYAQERLWFLSEMGQGDQYNMPFVFTVKGELRLDILQQSLDLIINRHESLRTYFKSEGGVPFQYFDEHLRIPIRYQRLVDLTPEERTVRVGQVIAQFGQSPFEMEYGPMARFLVIEMDKHEFIFGICLHHIISDGWSNTVLVKELSWFYSRLLRGEDTTLPALPVQYIDYTLWQRSHLDDQQMALELAHWTAHLQGYQDLNLPGDFPRPDEMTGAGAVLVKKFDQQLSAEIRSYSKHQSVTVFNTLTAAVYILLHTYSRQEDITVGMPVANRNHSDLEDLIGFFANTIVFRLQISGNDLVSEVLQKVKQELVRSQDHQGVPFEKIVDAVQPERELNKTPLFQVLINYMVQQETITSIDETLTLEPYGRQHESSKFDLHFSFYENAAGQLTLNLEYSTELYKEIRIAQMLDSLTTILEQIVRNQRTQLKEISLLEDTAKEYLLNLHPVDPDAVPAETIVSQLENICAQYGDRVAIKEGLESITYQELKRKSDRLAGYLASCGIRKNDLVAIQMNRTIVNIVSMVAILKAGGGYIAIDPKFPEDRKRFILEDSEAKHLMTQSVFSAGVTVRGDLNIINIDSLSDIDAFPHHEFQTHRDAEAVSYVIYTSGSTGKPKGVLQTHRTVVNLVDWQNQAYERTPEHPGTVTQFAAISFDVSVQEIFFTLLGGDTLAIIPEETKLNPAGLIDLYIREKVKIAYLPTAYLDYLCVEANKLSEVVFSDLERIIVAGEALRITGEIRRFFARNAHVKLENQYGPSETHVVTAYTMEGHPDTWENLPVIGAPIGGISAYVLNDGLQLVPYGAVGELYFSGAGLATAYLNNDGLTAEKFIDNPFHAGTKGTERLYKTGDLAYWTAAGQLRFIGRSDHQVKIRGYRIEPGEIEVRLSAYNGLDQAAVIVREIDHSNYLIAFYVADQEIPADRMKEFLAEEVPDYMIPSAFQRIAQIPMTTNGKTDLRQLNGIDVSFSTERTYVAPVTDLEVSLCDIWARLLKREKVGTNDHFFEIGGHSLLATQLLSQIRSEFKVEIALSSFFKQPTVKGCAKTIDESEKIDEADSLSSFIDNENELMF